MARWRVVHTVEDRREWRPMSEVGLSDEVLWYMKTRHIPMPTEPAPAHPEPGIYEGKEGKVFDAERVDMILELFSRSHPPKTPPTRLTPYQIAYTVAPYFGWIAESEITKEIPA